MKVKIEDIRAWVDGELDEPQATQVANAVFSDDRLQQSADKLYASQLPYREAYEQIPVPDVPDSLRIKIEALQNPAAKHSIVQNSNSQNPNRLNLPTDAANNSSFKIVGIAASMIMAALLGYLAGAKTAQVTPAASTAVDALMHPKNFAQTVAAYQAFYVRDTLKGTVAPNPAKVSERLANHTGMQVVIPEFEDFKFIRAQRLSFGGRILLQLVYLGDEGRPLALCYMANFEGETGKQSNGTETTKLQNHHGLNTAEWQHNGHRFVIVSGDVSEKNLNELSQSVRQQWSI